MKGQGGGEAQGVADTPPLKKLRARGHMRRVLGYLSTMSSILRAHQKADKGWHVKDSTVMTLLQTTGEVIYY
jgi:hypothetical protein